MSFSVYQQWRKKRVIGTRPDHTGCLGDADAIIRRGFKGLKQAIKLEYKLGRYDKVWVHPNVATVSLMTIRQQNTTKSSLLT